MSWTQERGDNEERSDICEITTQVNSTMLNCSHSGFKVAQVLVRRINWR